MADAIPAHFDGEASVRDGLGMRIPVRVRSQAWDASPKGPPRPIVFEAADVTAAIVLQSWDLAEAVRSHCARSSRRWSLIPVQIMTRHGHPADRRRETGASH